MQMREAHVSLDKDPVVNAILDLKDLSLLHNGLMEWLIKEVGFDNLKKGGDAHCVCGNCVAKRIFENIDASIDDKVLKYSKVLKKVNSVRRSCEQVIVDTTDKHNSDFLLITILSPLDNSIIDRETSLPESFLSLFQSFIVAKHGEVTDESIKESKEQLQPLRDWVNILLMEKALLNAVTSAHTAVATNNKHVH